MRMKKIAALCNAEKRYYLMNQKNAAGETVYQWLGDGRASYPLVGLPYMELENICAMFDITEKKRENLFLHQSDARETINWEDTDITERPIKEPKLCVRYEGRDLLPLETSEGITFIQEKYLDPLDSLEYMQLFERGFKGGGLYIVAKIGMIIQAVIMPMKLPDKSFMELLDDLTRRCRDAMWRQEAQRRAQSNDGESSLLEVDKSTGEVTGEGAEG